MTLTVILLTYNEEANLPKCFDSLERLGCLIFVVDSYSTDNTLKICEDYGAKVVQNKFETHTKQWEFAFRTLPITTEWILAIDADQEILPDLVAEIKETLRSDPPFDGYYLKRRNFFMGKWIRHGGYYPRYLLKLFRKDQVYFDPGEMMDHHFYVQGRTAKLKYDFVENNLKENLAFWGKKHIRYAALQACEEYNKSTTLNGRILGNQDERRIYLKNIWNRMPLFFRPFIYFIYRYIFQAGFLDGRTGLIFHFLQAFWYRFLVDAKIYELKRLHSHRD